MRIHFIGIGGIGVSALAKYYLSQGHKISGSDMLKPIVFDADELKKIKIYIGHNENNLANNTDLVIYTAAVPKNNPEFKKAKRLKIKTLLYAEALGELTKKFYTIAVSGMHGKSTTTAILASILIKAGFDPTVIIGSKIKDFGKRGQGSNFRLGKSKYLLIEADEFNKSFLNYWPKIIVLTNIEEEHLDCYKDLNDIMQTFKKYIGHLPKNGILVANEEDKNIRKLTNDLRPTTYNYSIKTKINGLKLKIPGQHNISNAMAALTVARALGIPDKISIQALNNFPGIWRRFEYKGKINGARVFDDYGHHPTEVISTLSGARSVLPPGGKLYLVFQPHQYHRTFSLFSQFVRAFDLADCVLFLDIYDVAGREDKVIKRMVSSEMLTEEIRRRKKNAVYAPSMEKALSFLRYNLKKNDIVVIMGAGDIWKLSMFLMNEHAQ